MQVASPAPAPTSATPRNVMAGEPNAPLAANTDPRLAQYKVIRRNGAVVGFEPSKIAIAVTKAFLAVNGGQSAASARVRELTAQLTDIVVGALMKRKPDGGAIHIEEIQDQVELALMRGGEHEVARAYVLYREKRSQERAHEKKACQGRLARHQCRRQRRQAAARHGAADRAGQDVVRRPGRRRSRTHPQGDAQGPVRRRADGRSTQMRRARSAHAHREGSRVQPGHRAPAARLAALRGDGRGSVAGRHGDQVRRVLSALHQARHQDRTAQRIAVAVRPEDARRRAGALARHAVRLSRAADALRPLFPRRSICRRPPLRTAAGVFHARGDGPGAQRSQSRSARDRVLQRAVDLRLHELDADAVQLGHASLAALVVLPDDGGRRSRRHLRSDQGKRAAVQVRRRTGQRLDQRARAGQPHQRHQRPVAGRRAVPQGGQRHRGRGEPGRQAQGRRVLVSGDVAPGHRGVPRAAQEHRRRSPAHARHEHRQLDSRPVHEAGDGRRRLDAVLALRRARPARQVGPQVRGSVRALRRQGRPRRTQAVQEDPGAAALAQDAVDAVRDRASVDHVQGCVQRALAAVARGRRAQLEPVHRDHAQHQRQRNRGLQPGLGQSA